MQKTKRKKAKRGSAWTPERRAKLSATLKMKRRLAEKPSDPDPVSAVPPQPQPLFAPQATREYTLPEICAKIQSDLDALKLRRVELLDQQVRVAEQLTYANTDIQIATDTLRRTTEQFIATIR
jgi:hypothetical protein